MDPLTLPTAVIIGAPKCGTSSLYFWLSAHPEVYASKVKETFFFADDVNRFNRSANAIEHTLEEYSAYFAGANGQSVVLEATAAYIYSQRAVQSIPSLASQPKCVVLLREPAARLYSQYRFERYRTKRVSCSFSEYIKDPKIIAHGAYAEYLSHWKAALGEDRLHVILFEDWIQDTRSSMDALCRFLGIDPSFYADYSFVQHNETVAIKSKGMHRWGLALQRYIPHAVQEALLPLYLFLNAGKMPAKDPEDQVQVNRLRRMYSEKQKDLEALFPSIPWHLWEK